MNSLSPKELVNVNNDIINQRQSDFEREKLQNRNPNYIKYTVGLPGRFNHFRSK